MEHFNSTATSQPASSTGASSSSPLWSNSTVLEAQRILRCYLQYFDELWSHAHLVELDIDSILPDTTSTAAFGIFATSATPGLVPTQALVALASALRTRVYFAGVASHEPDQSFSTGNVTDVAYGAVGVESLGSLDEHAEPPPDIDEGQFSFRNKSS